MIFRFNLILCLFVSLVGFGQEIQWISLDQAEELQKQNKKSIIILQENYDNIVYFNNLLEENSKLINEYYLPVKIKKDTEEDSIKIISGRYYIDVTITGWVESKELKTFLENPNRK
jgi:hypothetical protein